MKNKLNKLALIISASLFAMSAAHAAPPADSKSIDTVNAFYTAHTGSTLDDNKGAYDYVGLNWVHVSLNEWGEFVSVLEYQNGFAQSENQFGEKQDSMTRAVIEVNRNIGDTNFNFFAFNFLAAGNVVVENNTYLGASYDLNISGWNIRPVLAWNHTFGHSDVGEPNRKTSMSGNAGGAALLTIKKPFSVASQDFVFAASYEGQFARTDDYMEVYGKEDYGHVAWVGVDWKVSESVTPWIKYRMWDNWAAYSNDGAAIQVGVGYSF